jgi:hypothetical protein
MQERRRQIQASLHASGIRRNLFFGMMSKADLFQYDFRTQCNLFVRESGHRSEETKVLAGRE